jgi:hypothetical protein
MAALHTPPRSNRPTPHVSARSTPLKAIGWVLAGVACAIPLVVVGAVVVPRVVQQREAARLQAEDEADRDRWEAELARRDADRKRLGRMDQRDDRFEEDLASANRHAQCSAALAIGRTKRTEFAGTLHAMLRDSSDDALTVCVAHGLIDLGEIDAPLRVFAAWAEEGDRSRRRAAVAAFGEIGPAAADIALPYAEAELEHEHADVRINAAHTLSRLGPKARDLLERASHDQDQVVRSIASAGLERLSGSS